MQETEELFRSMARPAIWGIEPYDASTIEEPNIRLSANENNEGLPPSVLAAMRRALAGGNRYPDSRNTALREKLAACFSLRPEQIMTSNGLDGLFTMLGRAFLAPGDEVICGECTFGVYADTALIAGASVKKIPLGEGYGQIPADFAAAVGPATKMLFFCNPNNPTGAVYSDREIRQIAALARAYGVRPTLTSRERTARRRSNSLKSSPISLSAAPFQSSSPSRGCVSAGRRPIRDCSTTSTGCASLTASPLWPKPAPSRRLTKKNISGRHARRSPRNAANSAPRCAAAGWNISPRGQISC